MRCPSCASLETAIKGDIPQTIFFADHKLSAPSGPSSLFRCRTCGLSFRSPRPDPEMLRSSYKRIDPGTHWRSDFSARRDWVLAKGLVGRSFPEGSILDIGCWDGAFLDGFRNGWKRHGIEINPLAAGLAVSKGISLVAGDVSELDALSSCFDVITAFDMIEHTSDPLAFLRSMVKRLNPAGLIIASSGNTDSVTFKFMGSRYYYYSNPEHISFINPLWCRRAASRAGLRLEAMESFSHANKRSLAARSGALGRNLLYAAVPRSFTRLRMAKFRETDRTLRKGYGYPPSWLTANDHLLAVFRGGR
jgi:SAM-dependent methyltransferase